LGKIPLHQDLRVASDKGIPLTYSNPTHEVSLIFAEIAKKILY
jgi:MinD-like ATPase involved in chromosome partitioning or flagellar assembly